MTPGVPCYDPAKQPHLFHHLPVIGDGDVPDTRTQAPAQLIVQAGSGSLRKIPALTFSQLEDPVDKSKGAANGMG